MGLYITVFTMCVMVISLWEVAAGKSGNVHEVFKPDTELLTHETKALHMSAST